MPVDSEYTYEQSRMWQLRLDISTIASNTPVASGVQLVVILFYVSNWRMLYFTPLGHKQVRKPLAMGTSRMLNSSSLLRHPPALQLDLQSSRQSKPLLERLRGGFSSGKEFSFIFKQL